MRVRAVSMAAVLLGFTACSGGGGGSSGGTGPYNMQPSADNPAPTTPNTINATPAIAYNPQYLTVAAGTTVTFTFLSVQHGVTFTSPNSPNDVQPTSNASVKVVFPTAGRYDFHCPIHGYAMTGYVIVQ